MPVTGIEPRSTFGPLQVSEMVRPQETGFADHLIEFLKDANREMAASEKISADFAAGKTNNIHETVVAAERAEITFKLVGAMRNRLLDAYMEVMRMNV